MKNGMIEKHEEEVYNALYKYFDKIIAESGCLGTVMELGKRVGEDEDEYNKWTFDWVQDDSSGGFVFTHKNINVHAMPYYECAEGIAYAIFDTNKDELLLEGTLPLTVTGNSETDFEWYIGKIDDLIKIHNF